MSDAAEERLNVYDAGGAVIGAQRREEAKASGRAVGAVNVLLVSSRRQVLLQRRPGGVENGGRWDKSVGGHVCAGEEFDAAALRETAEELFDAAPDAAPLSLARDAAELAALAARADLSRGAVLRRISLQLNLRDVRHDPAGGLRNVLYHVAIYHGRCDVAIEDFRPQADEIEALRWFEPASVDRLLADGELAPNMAFLWLSQAAALLDLVPQQGHGC